MTTQTSTDSGLYIGVMSGTSHDGIDAALVDFSGTKPALISSAFQPYTNELREKLLLLNQAGRPCGLEQALPIGRQFSAAVAQLITTLLKRAQIKPDAITAIGCHGHTLRHQPDGECGYSFQLTDGAGLAIASAIPVVCDFRSGDIALGGTGAPLAPAFHHYLFRRRDENRAIVNIGGVANITLLPAGDDNTSGFDTGPGNLLIDFCVERAFGQRYDNGGKFARQGSVNTQLLTKLLAHPYLNLSPPKSTGRELFNGEWLLGQCDHNPNQHDLLATLVEFTAQTIASAITGSALAPGTILVCGGGSHNDYLMERLADLTTPWKLGSTTDSGLDADWVEAAAFAWLARQRLLQLPGNLPAVTGATRPAILGAVYLP